MQNRLPGDGLFVGAIAGYSAEIQAYNSGSLERSFLNPPVAARPGIWWYLGRIGHDRSWHHPGFGVAQAGRVWRGGDLRADFHRRPDALKSLSPEWLARVRFAAAECARLGLKLEVNASDGYVAGGPWITPALGMQRLVASETVVEGGRTISVTLPQPPTKLDYYRDVAVLAYPTPAGGEPNALPPPVCTSEPAGTDLKQFFGQTAAPWRISRRRKTGIQRWSNWTMAGPALCAASLTLPRQCKGARHRHGSARRLGQTTRMARAWSRFRPSATGSEH